MSRSIRDRLIDIIQSAGLAAEHAGNLGPIALAEAGEYRDATLFRIAVIGEAVSHLPVEVQALAPEIPWPRIKDMRNHIIHGYWQVDFRNVTETIALDFAPLKEAVRRLVDLVE